MQHLLNLRHHQYSVGYSLEINVLLSCQQLRGIVGLSEELISFNALIAVFHAN